MRAMGASCDVPEHITAAMAGLGSREGSIPPDFQAALEGDGDAKRFFEGLSYSNKRRFVLPIEEAKTAETRQKRIEKAISTLREGKI